MPAKKTAKPTAAKADIDGRASGTTVQGIRQTELRKVKVMIPSANVTTAFSNTADSLGDSEVQDPLQHAIKEILNNSDIQDKLRDVSEEVERKLREVADHTLENLREMNPEIASSLTP